MYLFGGLPVGLWSPQTTDVDHIRTWLLKKPLTAPEHQLARYILANLNWGNDGEVTFVGLTNFYVIVMLFLVGTKIGIVFH